MGFGTSNMMGSNNNLVTSMLGQYSGLTQQQSLFNSAAAASDATVQEAARQTLNILQGQTPGQQKKANSFGGVMDYIKTSPTGLANTPNTGLSMLG